MDISITICTHNRAEHLSETLAVMSHLEVPQGLRCELLVIDNASTDHTAQVIEQTPVTTIPIYYIYEPQVGSGHARNTSLRESRGDVILVTDDDVRPPQDWIERITAPILRGEAQVVAGGVRIAPHLIRPWMTPHHRTWFASTEHRSPTQAQSLIGANMAFSKQVLEKVPGFDPELGPGALGNW
jgi:glycosyltransferase involved in cell wall biosynthesis